MSASMLARSLPEDCLDELDGCACDGCSLGAGPCRDPKAHTCGMCGLRLDPEYARQHQARELGEVWCYVQTVTVPPAPMQIFL
mgnify:CR=1 FL=1